MSGYLDCQGRQLKGMWKNCETAAPILPQFVGTIQMALNSERNCEREIQSEKRHPSLTHFILSFKIKCLNEWEIFKLADRGFRGGLLKVGTFCFEAWGPWTQNLFQ